MQDRIALIVSLPPPGRTTGAVFQHDTLCGQFVADFIGACKIARGAGCVAFLDQRIDGLVAVTLKPGRGILLQNSEQPSGRFQDSRRVAGCVRIAPRSLPRRPHRQQHVHRQAQPGC